MVAVGRRGWASETEPEPKINSADFSYQHMHTNLLQTTFYIACLHYVFRLGRCSRDMSQMVHIIQNSKIEYFWNFNSSVACLIISSSRRIGIVRSLYSFGNEKEARKQNFFI